MDMNNELFGWPFVPILGFPNAPGAGGMMHPDSQLEQVRHSELVRIKSNSSFTYCHFAVFFSVYGHTICIVNLNNL
jgi:hypothetical protein